MFTIGLKYKVNRPGDRYHGKTGWLYRIVPEVDLLDDDSNQWHKYWLRFDNMPEGAAGYGFQREELEAL